MRNLQPAAVWAIFDEITRVPRPSKKEARIGAWLVAFAVKHSLEYRTDAAGNVVIERPASAGRQGAGTVVLQNHVDMVCEKNSGVEFDFERDPIETYVEDGWVRARGTTLGADNGLGMAVALALLIDPDLVAPRLEALFTVDEETGLTGAVNLGEGMITGGRLINLDSEDEGEIFIGCAGGIGTTAVFDFTWEEAPAGYEFFEVSVSGLKGGHSGDDIDKGRGNANKIAARLLQTASERMAEERVALDEADLLIAEIEGGNLHNAIPREARAVVGVSADRAAEFGRMVEKFAAEIREELRYSDAGVTVALRPLRQAQEPAQRPDAEKVIDAGTTQRLIKALVGVPNGVQAMSFAMQGLVETSTNLASVTLRPLRQAQEPAQRPEQGSTGSAGGQIVVGTSQRSSVESAKRAVAVSVEAVFALAGARVEHSAGYPGWAPNPSSALLEVTVEAYRRLFGIEPKVRAIHAGLECGLFLEKFPGLDMVSFGPTILGAHSPDERIEIASVEKFWRHLREVLKELK